MILTINLLVLCLQWKVGDRCLAVWSKNYTLYTAKIVEADEQRNICKVKYDRYDESEERPLVAICPLHDRRLSADDHYHQKKQKQDRRESRSQVNYFNIICIPRVYACVCHCSQLMSFFTISLLNDYCYILLLADYFS